MFAAIFERQSNIWINVKCNPDWTYLWRTRFESVLPAYRMNKWHWNSIILDGTVPTGDIKNMIKESYELTKKLNIKR